MKRIPFALLILASSCAFGAEATFYCTLREGNESGGQPSQEKTVTIAAGATESVTIPFESRVTPEVKIEGRYSPRLNSVDAELTDLRTGQRSNATDWFNQKGQPASASLVVNTKQGESFLLQCVKYPE